MDFFFITIESNIPDPTVFIRMVLSSCTFHADIYVITIVFILCLLPLSGTHNIH